MNSNPIPPRMLVVEDARLVAEDLCEALEGFGCEVCGVAADSERAIELTEEHSPDLVLMDVCIQGEVDGITTAEILKERFNCPVVFLTAYSDPQMMERAKALEPLGYIVKPFQEKTLRSTVEIALVKANAHRALEDQLELRDAELKQERVEKEELGLQLLQAQKMEAVGQLSGGIAHDFNNMLVPIIGYSDVLLQKGEMDAGEVREIAGEIKRAAESAASLTRQLLAFSRKQVIARVPSDLNGCIRSMQKMLRRIIGEGIQLNDELGEVLPPIEADEGQLQQVMLNLAVNARDAMSGEGTLGLKTYTDRAGEVVLEVSDTGCGMTPEVQAKLFEPFFTTKGTNGTGLGLSVVLGIIEQHEGTLDVDSVPGEGTRFVMSFPQAVRSIRNVKTNTSNVPVERRADQGSILLIEDEMAVLVFIKRALQADGHKVTACKTLAEAEKHILAPDWNFDLVLSDAVLPDGNGVEFLSRVALLHPETAAMLSSGYTANESVSAFAEADGVRFLQKPYTMEELQVAVDDAMHHDIPRPLIA